MAYPGPRGHHLDIPSPQRFVVTGAIAVLESAVEHDADDLHVAVAVLAEASARSDNIIIENPKHAVTHPRGITKLSE